MKTPINTIIPAAIRTLRIRANLTQGQVAKASGINIHTISRIELCHASPTLDTLEKITLAIIRSQGYANVKLLGDPHVIALIYLLAPTTERADTIITLSAKKIVL